MIDKSGPGKIHEVILVTCTISLRGDCKFQEKLKIIIQNFGRKTNSIMVFLKNASLYFALDKH